MDRQAGHLTSHWTHVAGLRIHAKQSIDPTPAFVRLVEPFLAGSV